MKRSILEWPRTTKRFIVVAMDTVLAVLAMWLAFTLRLDTLHVPQGMQWVVYLLAPLLAVPVFIKFGLYRAIFRYTGLAALAATAQAVAVYAVLLLSLLLWAQWPGVPRSMGVLQPLIFLLFVGASRAVARLWLAGQIGVKNTDTEQGRLLIYGAGSAGVQTAAAIRSGRGPYTLLGFVDDDPAKAGRSINELPVFLPTQVPKIVAQRGVTDILLALPSATRERRNQIITTLHALPVHIRTLPGLADLASGRVSVEDFHELDIEDLLGRKPVAPDPALMASTLLGKVVLVTGAGGSIGSELCRQIVREAPACLVLVDHNEFGLYSIHTELQTLCADTSPPGGPITLVPLLGSVRNYERMSDIFSIHRPDTVFHAAAYKHVPLVECNPAEGIANNVFGTLNMARAALENGSERFVLVSTDKAVRPTNIMGASKRMAELVLQALATHAPARATCFSMVRFGNVLGSSGSVVPVFRQQLANGGPITVTHTEVTRYFMTIPEAAQLVLQAGAMAKGGDVFVLDMGEPVKIMDLARRMVALSGKTIRDTQHPEGDIEIHIVGLRPGEKLYEELLIGENAAPTSHPRIMKAHEEYRSWDTLQSRLHVLAQALDSGDSVSMMALLRELVPGYHQERQTLP